MNMSHADAVKMAEQSKTLAAAASQRRAGYASLPHLDDAEVRA